MRNAFFFLVTCLVMGCDAEDASVTNQPTIGTFRRDVLASGADPAVAVQFAFDASRGTRVWSTVDANGEKLIHQLCFEFERPSSTSSRVVYTRQIEIARGQTLTTDLASSTEEMGLEVLGGVAVVVDHGTGTLMWRSAPPNVGSGKQMYLREGPDGTKLLAACDASK